MKFIALVEPQTLRYVVSCEKCANLRDKRIPMIVMYFNNLASAIIWSGYVKFRRSYWQARGYKYCQCVQNAVATEERRRLYANRAA